MSGSVLHRGEDIHARARFQRKAGAAASVAYRSSIVGSAAGPSSGSCSESTSPRAASLGRGKQGASNSVTAKFSTIPTEPIPWGEMPKHHRGMSA